ncbi:hypothetical protein DL95DRAFT_413726 [Leptodontidium sp. 2 PMI_412]|nr:hypothetical protein DL95DRAFT_413726 [Leptodontidium sp. 2 PMI_412]
MVERKIGQAPADVKSRLASQRSKLEKPNPLIKGLLPERALAPPTKDQYYVVRGRYKKEIEEPDVVPDLDTVKTFLWWTAVRSKDLPNDVYEEAKNYLRYDLANELKLENIYYDKEFTDWEDMKLAIRYILCTDDHNYMLERSRLHIILMFLLILDAGDRLGAIVRSLSHGNRDLNVALIYEDVQFYLRPLPTPDAQPEVKMIIRYNNRKGEQDDPEDYIDECKMKVPILRQWDKKRAATSETRALGADTITKDGQRIFRNLGCVTRFTFYCTRRAVFNNVVDGYQREKIYAEDEELQMVFRDLVAIRRDIEAARTAAERHSARRRLYLDKRGFKAMRKAHFETRDARIYQSLPTSLNDIDASAGRWAGVEPKYRVDLVNALYSNYGIAGAAAAIDKIVAHCSTKGRYGA